MLTSIVGVVILLGGLIFFHELGHYTVAKLFGIKVEVFSLGFGRKIFRKVIGETEYCVSLFPLGGYVKMMGDDPYKGVPAAEADRAFSTQKLYKRFLVVAAGPIANLLLAYVLFIIVFWVGQPIVSTKLGSVVVNSPAWEAGLRSEDRILDIGGTKVDGWTDLQEVVRDKEGQKVELKIMRGETEMRVPVAVSRVKTRNEYGEDVYAGGIRGISEMPIASMVGISNPASAAYGAGLRTGDVITKVNAQTVESFEDLNEALTKAFEGGGPVTFLVKRGTGDATAKETEHSFTLPLPKKPANLPALGLAQVLELYPSELFVMKLSPGSPAEKAGLQPGDRITEVAGTPVYSFSSIGERVQEAGGKDSGILFKVERAGKMTSIDMKPTQISEEDPITRETTKRYMVGFHPQAAYNEPEFTKLQIRDPLTLVPHAIAYTHMQAKRMLISLVKLTTGSISVKNLGGPVLIASVAGKSLDAGIIPFLFMMSMISINLFLLNLFPVPVLDGGHLLFFMIEAVKGKPVSIRTMEIANQVGMVFILMLVGLTFFNDISRILH